jgi:hypothetical protein
VATDDPVALFKSGAGLLYSALGAVGLITGLATNSMIAALNTIGIVGIGVLFIGWGANEFNDGKPPAARVKAVLTATAVGGGAFVVLWFLFARPLDAEEQQFGFLSFLGLAVLLIGATAIAYGKQLFEPPKKTCPHCANQVLAAAKVCQHCGRDLDTSVGT